MFVYRSLLRPTSARRLRILVTLCPRLHGPASARRPRNSHTGISAAEPKSSYCCWHLGRVNPIVTRLLPMLLSWWLHQLGVRCCFQHPTPSAYHPPWCQDRGGGIEAGQRHLTELASTLYKVGTSTPPRCSSPSAIILKTSLFFARVVSVLAP